MPSQMQGTHFSTPAYGASYPQWRAGVYCDEYSRADRRVPTASPSSRDRTASICPPQGISMQRCSLPVSSHPRRSTYDLITTYCTRRTSSFAAHTSTYRSRYRRQSLPRSVVASVRRQQASSTSQFRRSDFHGQGFTGIYEPGQPTGGPLGAASIYGVPKITPRALKDHLDQFVVGQERAKKVLSTAVYNHYQRTQEIQRREDEVVEYYRRQDLRHPVEGMA